VLGILLEAFLQNLSPVLQSLTAGYRWFCALNDSHQEDNEINVIFLLQASGNRRRSPAFSSDSSSGAWVLRTSRQAELKGRRRE
jgi:hypothetical protein